MAKLAVYRGDTLDREVEIGDRMMRIGRGDQNEIVLPDPAKSVSRFHAELRFEQGHYLLVDLNSQNGTWVAGRRVQQTTLEPGVPVVLGAFRLVLRADAPPPMPAAPVGEQADATLVLSPPAGPPAPPGPAPTLVVQALPGPPPPAPAAVPPLPPRAVAPPITPPAEPPSSVAESAPTMIVTRPPLAAPKVPPKAPPAPPAPVPAPPKPEPPAPKVEAPKPSPKVEAPKPAPKPEPPPPPRPAPPPPPAPAPAPAPAAKAPAAKPAKRGGGKKLLWAGGLLVLVVGVMAAAAFLTPAGRSQLARLMGSAPTTPAVPVVAPTEPPVPEKPPVAAPERAAAKSPAPAPGAPKASVEGIQGGKPRGDAGTVRPRERKVPVAPARPAPEVKARPLNLPEVFEEARAAMIKGDYLAAIAGFESILKVDPKYPNASDLLGVARGGARNAAQLAVDTGTKAEMGGDYAGAGKQYERALQLDPESTAAPDAIRRLKARMQGEGEDAFKRARQYDAAGRNEDAIKSYDRALQLLPPDHPSVKIAKDRLAALKGGL